MPAKNPRLTITMPPTLHAVFRRLSDLTGQSQSALIGELLQGSEGALIRMVKLLEASNLAKEQLQGKVAADLTSVQDDLERQLGIEMREEMGDLIGEAEEIIRRRPGIALAKRRAEAGPLDASKPPSSNRGVRSLTNATKTIAATSGGSKPEPLKRILKATGVGS